MLPILFEIFGFPVFSFTLFVGIAILGGLIISFRVLKKQKLPWAIIFDNLLLIFLFSFLCSRLIHVLLQFSFYQEYWTSIFTVWDGKFFDWGFWLCFWSIIHIFLTRDKQEVLKWFDAFVPGFCLSIFFLYVGSFFSGKNMGKVTELPWGVRLEGPLFSYSNVMTHPVDLYISIPIGLMFLFSLWYIYAKKHFFKQGLLFQIFLFVFALSSTFSHMFYAKASYFLFKYDFSLIFSLFLSVGSFLYIIYFHTTYGKKSQKTASRFSHRATRVTFRSRK